jgi:hypothetical protein
MLIKKLMLGFRIQIQVGDQQIYFNLQTTVVIGLALHPQISFLSSRILLRMMKVLAISK